MKNCYNVALATIIVVVGCLLHVQTQGQTNQSAQLQSVAGAEMHHADEADHICPTDFLTRQEAARKGMVSQLEQDLQDRSNTPTELTNNRSVRYVPVVFHVVYNNPSENISDNEVLDLLAILNEDFSMSNSMISSIRPEFAGIAANSNIKFCLASKDPQGNSSKGITRFQTDMNYFNPYLSAPIGNVGSANCMKNNGSGQPSWNPEEYINIWICNISNGANSGAAGYTYSPIGTTLSGLPSASIDGIVLDYNLGVQSGNSRAISHEMGHYFGLKHTWGASSGSCGLSDDGFQDTPSTPGAFIQSHASCASGANALSCEVGKSWQFENLMDYSDCFSMFTIQQVNYMNMVLSDARSGLLNSSAIHCTVADLQVPQAEFSGCKAITANEMLTLSNETVNTASSFTWEIQPATGWAFVNGTDANSVNPEIEFYTSGSYSVSLIAETSGGTDTETVSNCISVAGTAGINEENAAATFSVYPNPSNGIININLNGAVNQTQIAIYNSVGAAVYQVNPSSELVQIDLSAFSSGMYFVEVRSDKGVDTQRLLISK